MGALREWLSRNPVASGVIVAVLAVVAIALIFTNTGRRAGGQAKGFFYDMNKGQIFVSSTEETPPFNVDSGPEPAVSVMVYTCGDYCDQKDKWQIAFLLRYTDKGKDLIAQAGTYQPAAAHPQEISQLMLAADLEQEIKTAEGDKWVSLSSPESIDIQKTARSTCPDGTETQYTICVP